jgi:DNA-binding NarL/FixJ family response regulator
VQTTDSVDSTTRRRSAVAQTVAVASPDDLVVYRMGVCLSSHSIVIIDRAADVSTLASRVSEAGAIVLAGTATNGERRALIKAADERFPSVPIVVVASLTTNGVHKALEAGASGLVLERDVESALAVTIQAVCAGQVVVPRRFRHHAARPALSHREKQSLALAVAGMTNRQIAAHLFLAESTIKTHLTSAFAKLGVGSRSEAAALVHDPDEKLGRSILGASPLAPAPDAEKELNP